MFRVTGIVQMKSIYCFKGVCCCCYHCCYCYLFV